MRRLLWFCGFLCALPIAYGAVIEVCSEAELRDAMALGGMIHFGCDTQIVLSATLQAKTDVVIDANGHAVTISGGGAVRVFEVANGVSFTINDLKIVNGLHKGADAVVDSGSGETAGEAGRGGALAATNATIRIESCILSNNVARGGAAVIGGVPPLGGALASAGEAFGGAVFSRSSTLEIIGSEFRANRAEPGGYGTWQMTDGAGGAIFVHEGTLSLEQTRIEENHSVGAGGGVATVDAALEADQCEFEKNVARARIGDRFGAAKHGDGKGGALHLVNTEAEIALSTFSKNSLGGGGAYSQGGGSLTGGAIYADKDLTVNSSIFSGNSIVAVGHVNPVTNSAGGALWVGRTAWISESRFVNNSVIAPDAQSTSSGDVGLPGNGFGGGIFVGGSLIMEKSSFVSNVVMGGVSRHYVGFPIGTPGVARGAGIYSSNVMMTNVTIAFNEVVRWDQASSPGGALFLGGADLGTSESAIHFCTFATNGTISVSMNDGTKSKTFSQLQIENGSSAAVFGSILSGGTNGTVVGTIVDEGYNISSDGVFTQVTSKNATDAKLGTIGNYGGSTETLPVLAGSPAIDAVMSGTVPNTDQRGRTRPYGAGADIGAYELSAPFFVRGRIQHGIDFGDATVTASGENLILDESSGEFSGFFPAAGSLTPTMAGVVFFPEAISLVSGEEVFDAWFVGYIENQVAVELDVEGDITVTFAAENTGEYVLQSSSDLTTWDDVDTRMIAAHALFRTEVPASGSNLFYRVKGP